MLRLPKHFLERALATPHEDASHPATRMPFFGTLPKLDFAVLARVARQSLCSSGARGCQTHPPGLWLFGFEMIPLAFFACATLCAGRCDLTSKGRGTNANLIRVSVLLLLVGGAFAPACGTAQTRAQRSAARSWCEMAHRGVADELPIRVLLDSRERHVSCGFNIRDIQPQGQVGERGAVHLQHCASPSLKG